MPKRRRSNIREAPDNFKASTKNEQPTEKKKKEMKKSSKKKEKKEGNETKQQKSNKKLSQLVRWNSWREGSERQPVSEETPNNSK